MIRAIPLMNWVLIGVLCLCGGANAAPSADAMMDPPLAAVFPLENGADGVHVRFPVLISDRLILRTDVPLRLFYTPPPQVAKRSESADNLDKVHTGASRPHSQFSASDPDTGADEKNPWVDNSFEATMARENARKTMEAMRQSVWTSERDFHDFLASSKSLDFNVVYRVSGVSSGTEAVAPPSERGRKQADPHIRDEAIDFPKGLFLGQPGGKVTILSLQKGGASAQAGLRPGDEIVALNSQSLQGSLEKFVAAFSQIRKSGEPLVFTVQRSGATATLEIKMAAPISLKGSMLDQP